MIKEGLLQKKVNADLVKNTALDKKVVTLATKAESKAEQDKITKLKVLDSSYFCGKSSFEDSGTEIYLLFQPMCRYFKKVGDTDHTSA